MKREKISPLAEMQAPILSKYCFFGTPSLSISIKFLIFAI